MKRLEIGDWIILWSKLNKKKKQTDVEWRLNRIMHELGDVANAIAYEEYHGDQTYRAEAKKNLGDMIAQSYMLALCLNFDIAEIEKIGFDELNDALEKRLTE